MVAMRFMMILLGGYLNLDSVAVPEQSRFGSLLRTPRDIASPVPNLIASAATSALHRILFICNKIQEQTHFAPRQIARERPSTVSEQIPAG
jgi:hypothetical protein